MKISELTIRQGNVEIEGTITEFGEKRTFNKYGKNLTVVNATMQDETGSIKLTLWNDDADKVNVGDMV